MKPRACTINDSPSVVAVEGEVVDEDVNESNHSRVVEWVVGEEVVVSVLLTTGISYISC